MLLYLWSHLQNVLNKLILNNMWKGKRPRIVNTIRKNENDIKKHVED